MVLDDLIFKFLLQSGFPRASIVSDVASVLPLQSGENATFIIVDPESVLKLAVIAVIGPKAGDELISEAAVVANYASRLGGKSVLGFTIRVDSKGNSEQEQVQFYQCWPNSQLKQLSARIFPDFESLRVANKIAVKSVAIAKPVMVEMEGDAESSVKRFGKGAYIPAFLLLILVIIDWSLNVFRGQELLNMNHSLLLVGAAALLSLPALLRFVQSE